MTVYIEHAELAAQAVTKPTVGRIVHFYDARRVAMAALVTSVVPDSARHVVTLAVFSGSDERKGESCYIVGGVPHGAPFESDAEGRYWVWPPR